MSRPERCHVCLEEIRDPREFAEVEVQEDGREGSTVLVAVHLDHVGLCEGRTTDDFYCWG
jgi:hypothetical protein